MALVKEGNSSNVIVMHCLLVMRTFKLVIQITRYKISAKACRALKPRSGKHLPCAVLTSTVNFLLFLFDVAKRIVTDQLFPFFLLLFSLSILLSIERERERFFPKIIYIYIKLYIQLVPAFRGMGDTEKEGNNHDQTDRDESEATSCARGWRGGGGFRAPCHHEHNRGRRATGAHHAGSKSKLINVIP